MSGKSIRERITIETLKNANKQQQKFINLGTELKENKITPKEYVEQAKKIPITDMEAALKLRQETTIEVIIDEIEELKKKAR